MAENPELQPNSSPYPFKPLKTKINLNCF